MTDIFSRKPGDLPPALVANGPSGGGVAHLPSNGVDPVKIATLQTILVGGDLADIDAVVARCPDSIASAGEEGPWVYELSAIVQEGLANGRTQVLRDRWAQTEEWRAEGWPRAAFDRWFDELCDLARASASRQERLYLWVCL